MILFQRHTLLWLCIILLFASCEGSRQPSEPTRVLLAYIGVDNNLNSFETDKLQGLCDGWTGQSTDRIFAYVDRVGGGASLYELSVPSASGPLLIESYGSENSASFETFGRVVHDILNTYEADSYGLLVFSHASGWLPAGTLYNPNRQEASQQRIDTRSIVIDGTSEMELADFAQAIPDGAFDYIAFETCFMAGIEVAYELRHKTQYILASSAEIVHPGFTPIYATSTHKLLSGDLMGFGQDVFNHVLSYGDDEVLRSATYSVIRTSEVDALVAFVRSNCDFGKADDIWVSDIQHFDRLNGYRLFFDFEDYYSRLLHADAQRVELKQLLAACVVWKASTESFMTQQSGYNGFKIEKHSGLTTYIPQQAFPRLNKAYKRYGWASSL